MKKTFVILASALLALASCQEWEPVFTGSYDDVYMYEAQELEVTATIAELKELYAKHGVLKIEDDDMVISGKVISDDHSGNIYRELYIQDETGVISVKLGLTSLYCDYKLGQTVYVKCGGLTIGQYNGMPQLGVEDPTGEYETSYLDNRYLIDAHVIRGAWGDPVPPLVVTEAELQAALTEGYTNKLWGQLVTISDLQYGAKGSYTSDKFKRIFILLYVDPYKDKKASTNRVFCSSGNHRLHGEGEHPRERIGGDHQPLFPSAAGPSGPDPHQRLCQVRGHGDRSGHHRRSERPGRRPDFRDRHHHRL